MLSGIEIFKFFVSDHLKDKVSKAVNGPPGLIGFVIVN